MARADSAGKLRLGADRRDSEADEPNSLVDFPDAERCPAGTVELSIFLLFTQKATRLLIAVSSRVLLDAFGAESVVRHITRLG
jgi:hypothetical protein